MMKQTLLIERVMNQTRMAVIEDGALCELVHERPGIEDVAGNIYLGRVENVVPGMSAAFVNIGLEKNGFLAAGDLRPDFKAERGLIEALEKQDVKRLARPGQEILVQAVKSQPGAKGPRLSSQIALPGRLMVLLPQLSYVGVSKKIVDAGSRSRLLNLGRALAGAEGCGMILRTASESAAEEALRTEYDRLLALWRDILARCEHSAAPKLLYNDNSLLLRAVRDRLGEQVEALWADGQREYEQLCDLAASLAPQWRERVRLHEGSVPLFDLYRVDAQADKALDKFVWLKGGGSLVIQETEAFTAVDVNTAKNVGRDSAQDTILKNNLEAARELMRQLRLRDIGGIIVADFINMTGQARREALLEELRACAARDANRTNVVDITPLGLVEITRKKARQPLSGQLLHTCSHCGGNGRVFSHEATARRALRDIWRRRRGGEANPILCEAAPEVCGWMKTIGTPEGGAVYARPVRQMQAGEYRLSPADPSALPPETKPLK